MKYTIKPLFLLIFTTVLLSTTAFARSGSQEGGGMVWLVALALAVVTFCLIFFGVKSAYGSEGKDKPYPLQEQSKLRLTNRQDVFLRSYTTSVRISNGQGGHGGRGGGHGRR